MELTEAMRTSSAARDFSPEPVPDEVVWRVLDVARFAPSGGNQQPWTVLLIKKPELRRALRDLGRFGWREYMAHRAAGVRPFAPGPDGRWHGPAVDLAAAAETPSPSPLVDGLDTVPVLLVVAVRLTALAVMDVDLDRQSVIGGGSIYPFTQNILLAARGEGLGGALTTFIARREPAVAELLGIPPDHGIAALIALGHPTRVPTRLKRRGVETFARIDTWDGPPLEAKS